CAVRRDVRRGGRRRRYVTRWRMARHVEDRLLLSGGAGVILETHAAARGGAAIHLRMRARTPDRAGDDHDGKRGLHAAILRRAVQERSPTPFCNSHNANPPSPTTNASITT